MVRSLVPDRLRRSYPLKLVVVFTLVSVVIGAVGAGLYVQIGSILERETETELRSAAELEAKSLAEWFDQKRLQTRRAAQAAPLQSDDETVVSEQLWTVVDQDADIQAAYVVDTANGSVVTSVGTSRIVSAKGVLRSSGQDVFTRRDGDDGVAVSGPIRPYPESSPIILFSSPVSRWPNRTLVTAVDLERFSRSQPHRLDRARFQVLADDGSVVMAENESRILAPAPVTGLTGTGFRMTEYAGTKSAVGFASVGHDNWTVTARIPADEAFVLRSAVLEGVSLMLVSVILGLGALAVTLTRDTIAPVRELAATARRLEGGTLDEPITTDRCDEFGDLYRAFEEMRVSLRNHIEQVERARFEAEHAKQEADRARRESERLMARLEAEADRFGTVMAACAEGELDRRLDPKSDSEPMIEIADAFNAMMADVQKQNEQLEAVSSIISHDLRNPLAVAYGRAEILAEQESTEHVDCLLESLARMETIIEDGMALARGADVETTTPVRIDERAEQAWSHVDNQEATLSIPESKTVSADPDLLEQVFENLFRNAIEHAGAAPTITVGVTDQGFYVEDDGPGLESTDSLFEPGVSDGTSGTGLGLTIVKRIAQAHDWRVRATNGTTGARFEFVISTPPMADERPVGTVSDGGDLPESGP